MQVKFIALAIAAMAATPAFAQGSVEIYGSLDALFSTKTNDGGLGITLDNTDQKKSRLGFKGEEKLGHGLTAFFQLEQRFYLNNGQNDKNANNNLSWSDKAWIGLSGAFGSFNFGRHYCVVGTRAHEIT